MGVKALGPTWSRAALPLCLGGGAASSFPSGPRLACGPKEEKGGDMYENLRMGPSSLPSSFAPFSSHASGRPGLVRYETAAASPYPQGPPTPEETTATALPALSAMLWRCCHVSVPLLELARLPLSRRRVRVDSLQHCSPGTKKHAEKRWL